MHVVISTIGTYEVDTENLTCTCSFKQTLGLPCRHLFFARSYLQLTTFQTTMVADRWLKSYQIINEIIPQDEEAIEVRTINQTLQIDKVPFKPKEKVTLSQSQKYTKMLKFCQKLAAIASQCGMPEFCEKFSTIESIIELWDKNIPFYIQKVRYILTYLLFNSYYVLYQADDAPLLQASLSNGPSANVSLPDVKVGHTFEANVDEKVEIEQVSKLHDDFEVTIASVDPKNSDQLTIVNQGPQVTVETYDNQVDAKPVVTADAEPVVTADVDPVVTADADPVVMADADPVVTADVDPVVTADANPVVMADADPVVMALADPVVNADPVGEVMCNVNNTPAVDSRPTEKSLALDHHHHLDKKVAS